MQIWQIYLPYLHYFQCNFVGLIKCMPYIQNVFYICSNSMQFWQCSILLQFLQIINAKDFAFRSLQNLQLSTSAYCSFSLQWFIAVVHYNSKCNAVIPLQFQCKSTAIICSVVKKHPMGCIWSKLHLVVVYNYEMQNSQLVYILDWESWFLHLKNLKFRKENLKRHEKN